MSSQTAKTVFLVVFVLWFLSEIIGGYIIPDLRRGETKINHYLKILNTCSELE